MKICTDCLNFRIGCEKNTLEWIRAKECYPVTKKEADLNRRPMTTNEKQRLRLINAVARNCDEFKQDPAMEGL
jgi:hypothetical protein